MTMTESTMTTPMTETSSLSDCWPLIARVIAEPGESRAGSTDESLPENLGTVRDYLRVAESRDQVSSRISRLIAEIDHRLKTQVDAILHHPAFQRLEASWRGLRFLVEHAGQSESVKIKVLSIRWRELKRDLDQAIEFDQSKLFNLVYEEEFGRPGGEPYGVLLGDYWIGEAPMPEEIDALEGLAGVAAAAFSPFISAAAPALLGLESFEELPRLHYMPKAPQSPELIRWQSFRSSEDSRFIGLVVPRVLARAPYQDDGSRSFGFPYRESVSALDRSEYLWMNPAYAIVSLIIRAFAETGWLADIQGLPADRIGSGEILGLVQDRFRLARDRSDIKMSTEFVISDLLERQLAEQGFMSICQTRVTGRSGLYACPSVQKPRQYTDDAATVNARLSAMLNNIFCASRFAHYIKVIARDKTGSVQSAQELQNYLGDWISRYIRQDDDAAPHVKARFPLRQADVRVHASLHSPGTYECELYLVPHYQLESIAAGLNLSTEVIK